MDAIDHDGLRTKEIGVRLALGASSSEVLYATLRSTLVLVCAGLAAGGGVAWWVGRFADRFLHGISPSDPASLGTAALLLGGTAVLAALVPALRILRIDPVRVLRAE